MFSVFNKGIGKATQFAQSHIFPALKTDYKAVRLGARAFRRGYNKGGFSGGFIEGMTRFGRTYDKAGMDVGMGLARMTTYTGAAMGMGYGMMSKNTSVIGGGIGGALFGPVATPVMWGIDQFKK